MQLPMWVYAVIVIISISAFYFYLALLKWKKWAADHRAWQQRNCVCNAPGGDPEPPEPGFP